MAMRRAATFGLLVALLAVFAGSSLVEAAGSTVPHCKTYNYELQVDYTQCLWTGCESGGCPSDGNTYTKMCESWPCTECTVNGQSSGTRCCLFYQDAYCCKWTNQISTCNTCEDGYALQNNVCTDINECAAATPPCDSHRECVNSAGGFSCLPCSSGYKDNGPFGCSACEAGTWGPQCVNNCTCTQGACDIVTGACLCEDGWYGDDCTETQCGDGMIRGDEECENLSDSCCDQVTCKFKVAGSACESDSNRCTIDVCESYSGVGSQTVCTHNVNATECFCGNNVVDPIGETCDEGNLVTPPCPYGEESCVVCSELCQATNGTTSYCGDGVLHADNGEQCDDGNSLDNDGCSSTCTKEPGFKCVNAGEACSACSLLDPRSYGIDCALTCTVCSNNATCGSVDGSCICQAPWIGTTCTNLPRPGTTDVTAIVPTTIQVDDRAMFTLTGAFPSSFSSFAFVPTTISSNICDRANMLGVSQYETEYAQMSSALANAGTYHVCYSTNPSDASYVHQVGLVLNVTAKTATEGSITSIAPSTVSSGRQPSITFNGAIPSAQTYIGFSNDGCGTVHLKTAIPQGLTRPPTVKVGPFESAVMPDGPYTTCYSVDDGVMWSPQSTPAATLTMLTSTPNELVVTAINGATDVSFVIGETVALDLTGPTPNPVSLIGLTKWPSYSCGSPDFVTTYDNPPVNIGTFSTFDAGLYTLCYSANGDSSAYTNQALVTVTALAPVPTATSISNIVVGGGMPAIMTTAMATATITALSSTSIQLVGLTPSPTTMIALVPTGSVNCDANRVSETPVPGPTDLVTILVSTAGEYNLCYYTGTAGSSWVMQTSVSLEVLPAAASGSTISSISTSGTVPAADAIYAGVSASFVFNGGSPSTHTVVAFVPGDKTCADASDICPPNLTGKYCHIDSPDTPNPVPEGEFPLYAKGLYAMAPVSLVDSRMVAGEYAVCYSTDDGVTYTQQDASLRLRVLAPPAQADSISAVSLTSYIRGATADATFTGAMASPLTYVAFSRDSCATVSSQTLLSTSNTVSLTVPAAADSWTVCYTTSISSGWVAQGVSILVLPVPASTTSVTSVSPNTVFVADYTVTPTFALLGADKSATSKYALTRTTDGCAAAETRFAVSDYGLTSQQLSAPLGRLTGGTWYVCYSTDSGATWFQQATGSIVVRPALTDSDVQITEVYDRFYSNTTSGEMMAGRPVLLDFVPLMPSPFTVVRISITDDCAGSASTTVPYTTETVLVPGFNVAADVVRMCVSVDAGNTFTPQNLRFSVFPPEATPTTITSMSSSSFNSGVPTTAMTLSHKSAPFVSFNGAYPSPHTVLGFVRTGDDCDPQKFVPITGGPVFAVNLTATPVPLFGQDIAGSYELCLTTARGGVGALFKQTGLTLTVVPATATPGEITALSPMHWIVQQPNVTVTITGGLPSTLSRFGVVLPTAPNCSPTNFITSALFTSRNVVFAASLPSAGTYHLCYSTNNGGSYIAQTAVTIQGVPPPSTATTVTALSPPWINAGSAFTMSFIGVIPSAQTYVGFVKMGEPCSAAQGLRYAESAVSFAAIDTVGTYELCVSTGVDSGSFIKQTLVTLEARVPPASGSSISQISPRSVIAGASVEMTFYGFVPSSSSKAGFIVTELNTPPTCSDKNKIMNVVDLNKLSSYDLPTPFEYENSVYRVCVSADGGNNYVLQTNALTYLNVTSAASVQYLRDTSALDGVYIVAGVFLVVFIAVIVGAVYYLKHKKDQENTKLAEDIVGMPYTTASTASIDQMMTSNPLYQENAQVEHNDE